MLAIDAGLVYYFPFLNRLPLQLSLALGPLIYFYVLKIIRPEYDFRTRDLLHFSPLLFELAARGIEIGQLSPVLHVTAFISVSVYLYLSHGLIKHFYKQQSFIDGDRYRYKLRWLRNLLTRFEALWLLWVPISVADYFFYHQHLSIQVYYTFYLLLMSMIIYMAVRAHLRTELSLQADASPVLKQLQPADLKQKGNWVKRIVKERRYYEDPELTLSSLADKLGLTIHELSRIINTALNKNFHDFISEYRVADVVLKMQDPAYDHITLLGIAYDSGFNAKSTFNRIFKEMTGMSPAEYKTRLKKEFPVYKPGRQPQFAAIISNHETTPTWSSSKSNRNLMIRNYLKVAWRNLQKNKAHTFINISGLSVGLACSLLILLWVQNEKSIDGFHSDRLYRVYETVHNSGQVSGTYDGPGPLATELPRIYPEVQYAVSMGFGEFSTFQVGDKVLKEAGNSAGPDYFKMYNYKLLQGTPQTALNTPSSLAISRKMAEDFYGSPANAIGKAIRYQNNQNFTVTAVFENLPHNASLTFDFLTNWDVFLSNNTWARDMGNNGPACYVLLKNNANAALLNNKMHEFFDHFFHVNRKTQPFYIDLAIQPYAETYLDNDLSTGRPSGGRIETVRLFSLIAVFILLIACINFMNLTTARSVKRAREVGVRKAVGALRSSLIQQFIGESMMITTIAVTFSLALVMVLLPVFNEVTQKQISLPFFQWQFWLTVVSITLVTGLISGSYPALFMSSLNPVKVLKGALKLDTGTTIFRKGLVVFQFVLSAVLITGTVIISRQMNYIQSRYLGYDKANLVYVSTEGEIAKKYPLFKQELLSNTNILSVSRINTAPQDIYGSTGAVGWIGKDTTRIDMFTQISVGYDFMKTMKLEVAGGRDFSKDYPTDTNNFILNETAVKATGYKDPIGKPFRLFRRRGTIIGVVKDFNFHSMNTKIGPIVFHYDENTDGVALIRMQPGKTREALAGIEKLCKEINPAFPPTWYFVDQEYQKMYQNEQVINKLADAFSFLAIFISCLGLLGLAMFTAEQRLKEISIRKVLGASISTLFALLSREFIVLVSIAFVLAIPISWYAMNKWLLNYVYHTPLQWWMFALSDGLILLIALATISFQVIKAALVNPVRSLRSE